MMGYAIALMKKLLIRIRSGIRFRQMFRRQYRDVLRDLAHVEPGKGDRILFNLFTSVNIKGLSFEFILAARLHQLGASTMILVDDGLLDQREFISVGNTLTARAVRRRQRFTNAFLQRFPNVRFYSQLISPDELSVLDGQVEHMTRAGDYHAEGIDLWPYIEASIIRYYRSAVNEWNDEPDAQDIRKMYTRNALLSLMVARNASAAFRPDRFLSSHGIYTSFGPPYAYHRQAGLPCYIYDVNYMKPDCVVFSREGLVANGFDDGFTSRQGHTIDAQMAEEFTERMLGSRKKGDANDLRRMSKGSKGVFDISVIRDAAKDNEVFALFPNVLWDASIIEANSIFPNSRQWILQTIRYFSEQEGKKLIVRAHPSEFRLMSPRVTVRKMIENHFKLPVTAIPNLIFIDSDVKLRSYELFEYLTAGIVYNGTIGMELIYADVPLLLAGVASYSFLPTILGLRDTDDYFRQLGDIPAVRANQLRHKEELYRFIYMYFFLNLIPLGYLGKDGTYDFRQSAEERLGDPVLTYIAETVLGKHEFFQGWYAHLEGAEGTS